jgi:hypothetical protein
MPSRFNGARQVQVPRADVITEVLEIVMLEIDMALGAGDTRRRLS